MILDLLLHTIIRMFVFPDAAFAFELGVISCFFALALIFIVEHCVVSHICLTYSFYDVFQIYTSLDGARELFVSFLVELSLLLVM